MSAARWTKIPTQALPRSSHSVSLVNDKVYIFGGEIKPRQPVDNAVHVIDVSTGNYATVEGTGDIPEPRVGHVGAAIKDTIYIFGGRGGPDMTPLEEQGAVYAFSTTTSSWTRIAPTSSAYPAARSYHCATATPKGLIVHAGCGDAATGRLGDTWLFDVTTHNWTQLANAPGDGRGGTSICYHDGRLWRFGGFNGKTELGGSIDYLPLTDDLAAVKWQTVAYGASSSGNSDTSEDSRKGPGARSVHALLPFGGKLLTFFGEGKPSPTGGHDSAGNFWSDVWLFDPRTSCWEEANIAGDVPRARGWFDADVDGKQVVVWGGIDSNNERLGDGWVLEN